MKAILASTAVLATLVAVPALASTGSVSLQQVSGPVLVNTGAGFKSASADTALQTGDRVMVRTGGQAFLVYPDGCRVRVNVGSPVTVSSVAPCAGATAQTSPPPAGPAAGAGLGGLGGGAGMAGLAFGGLAAASLAVGLSDDSHNDAPVSR